MILDKPRALICTGVLCVVAVTGGARVNPLYKRPRVGAGLWRPHLSSSD